MRKTVKKVVALASVVGMTATMGISAFALADHVSYTFVGNPHLFGMDEDLDEAGKVGWVTGATEQFVKDDDGDGIYTGTFNCCKEGEYEYKVVGDGDLFSWNYQLCLGNPNTAWADNQTQFKANFKEGEFNVAMDPTQGFLVCVQNGQVVDFTIRYKSRDEDSMKFVEPSKAGIEGDGYTDVPDFDAAFATFKEKAVSLFGGAAAEPETTTAAAEETTTAAAEETTTAAAETTTAAAETTTAAAATTAAATATTASKPVQTGDVAPVAVMAALVAAAGIATVAAKKKEA